MASSCSGHSVHTHTGVPCPPTGLDLLMLISYFIEDCWGTLMDWSNLFCIQDLPVSCCNRSRMIACVACESSGPVVTVYVYRKCLHSEGGSGCLTQSASWVLRTLGPPYFDIQTEFSHKLLCSDSFFRVCVQREREMNGLHHSPSILTYTINRRPHYGWNVTTFCMPQSRGRGEGAREGGREICLRL